MNANETTETPILNTIQHALFSAAPKSSKLPIEGSRELGLLLPIPFDPKAESALRQKLEMLWRLASPDERKFLNAAFEILAGKTLAELLGKPEGGDQ
jgi:hypothetical protein